jgi:hypothetical protein
MILSPKEDQETANFIRKNFEIPKNVVKVEESSVLVVDDRDRRWRLPKSSENFTEKIDNSAIRICREVATERDLMNLHGTFYELPAENADGFAKIRPIATHNLAIHDYASYRGLLIMTGLDSNAKPNEHVISSTDGKAKVWAGSIDDLWTLGKPKGHGGPWLNSEAITNTPSDPYLIGFYDQKKLQLSHKSHVPVTFKIEIEAIGHGPWMTYKEVIVKPNETFEFTFPSDFQARWIRFSVDKNCNATSILNYE